MPTTATATAATTANNLGTPHPNPFLERMIRFLMPYFADLIPDPADARLEILETLATYGGRTRAEVINAARIIAFSFSALEMLADARDPALSPSMRLRYNGCANGLNRSCHQNEQTLAKRLAYDPPDATTRNAEPIDDMPEPAIEDAIDSARAQIAAYRNRASAARAPVLPSRPQTPAEQDQHKHIWGAAMMNVLAEMGMPVQPAATG